MLPPGSAEPGAFNSRRAPWVVAITEAVADPVYSSVVAVMGSQMSKTDGVILNSIGWQLDDDPQPILYIGPTQKNTESISTDRVSKMIRSVPSLFDGLAKGKKDKITEKYINGVRLGFGWAGSATELASHPAAKVFIDERDRMGDVGGEGDVNTLADARTATYDGCVVTTSTPLVGDVEPYIHPETGMEHWKHSDSVSSPTWALWQEGSKHEWALPCPECREYFIPRFKLLWWPKDSSPNAAFKSARLTCPSCDAHIENSQKEKMNSRGVFVAPGQKVIADSDGAEQAIIVNDDGSQSFVGFGSYLPPSERTGSVSFWVSGLCSPWRTFGHRARTFLNAVASGEQGRVQAAINTGFGELYRVSGDAPSWEVVANLREPYAFDTVPDDVQVVTCGVDVQKDRLIYVIRGWGAHWSSWLIRHGEIYGETEHDQVWNDLAKLLTAPVGQFRISRMVIDSGYRPGDKYKRPDNQIYLFCRRFNGFALASKGHETLDKPYKAAKIDVSVGGKIIKHGLQLWHLNSDYLKSWVHSRLEWPEDQPGRWHLSQDTTDDYCQQLVAEARSVKPSGQITWIRIRKDNHYLDCEALNVAAAHILQIHTLRPKNPDGPAIQTGRRVRHKGIGG